MLIWSFCVLLIVLLILSMVQLMIYKWDVRKMTNQLDGIIEKFGTNERLRTNSRNRELELFASRINYLISVFKKEQQSERRTTRELKEEITNISHDLRTPLTSIKGFAGLLMSDDLSKEEKNEYISIIRDKVDSLTDTVDLFYEMSKVDSDDQPLVIEEMTVQDILITSLLTFYPDFESRKIQVDINENYMDTVIVSDQKALERIIINITQNALRYGASFFQVSAHLEKHFLVLKAVNDASFLDSGKIHRVFDRTYTMDESRQSGQTGLGLYIVKKLSEKQGGKAAAFIENDNFVIEIFIPRK